MANKPMKTTPKVKAIFGSHIGLGKSEQWLSGGFASMKKPAKRGK